jgi:hypothetical protein
VPILDFIASSRTICHFVPPPFSWNHVYIVYPTPYYNLRESIPPPSPPVYDVYTQAENSSEAGVNELCTHTVHTYTITLSILISESPPPLPLYTMTSDDPIRSRTRALYPVVSGARAVEATPWADLTAGRPPPGTPQWPPRRTHSSEKKGWGSEAAVQHTYRHNRELKIRDKTMSMLK